MPATMTARFRGLAWRAGLLAASLLLAMPGSADAQRVEGDRAQAQGIYQAEVQVRSQAEDERNRGFSRALVQVLAKLSGDRQVAERPGLSDELRRAGRHVRSEEHTSEIQSLMRISYAVFCLK